MARVCGPRCLRCSCACGSMARCLGHVILKVKLASSRKIEKIGNKSGGCMMFTTLPPPHEPLVESQAHLSNFWWNVFWIFCACSKFSWGSQVLDSGPYPFHLQ